MILQTERLVLRPILREDDADIFAYSREENVGPNAGWKPHESIEETREIMEQIFLGQAGVFGMELKGKLIGTLGLIADPKRENDKVRMLGYALGQSHWGKGLMTEAARAVVGYGFETLELDLISAYCYPHNVRSRSVLKKLGFYCEGTLKLCERLYNGAVYDNECYALVKAQWGT